MEDYIELDDISRILIIKLLELLLVVEVELLL